MPPQYMLDMGKQTSQFFDSYVDHYGHKKYRLKSIEQYSREHNTNEQPGKQYFKANSLPEIIKQAPMPTFKATAKHANEVEKGTCLTFLHVVPAMLRRRGTSRDEQSSIIHRLRARTIEHESDRAVDASASAFASIHHRREVVEALECEWW